MNTDKVAALLNPTSIAILGARENPSGWTARIFANTQRFGFAGPVWPVNPRHDEMWGVKCYPDLAALPAVPDHLVVMRAAATVAATLREAADMGTRSATLYAAGFSEAGTDEGRRLEDELRGVIEEIGIAISGPNCLGNLSARARLLTLPDDRMRDLVRGPVAMVGQSGTTTPGIGRAVIDRGIDIGTIVTSGNEVGLTTADYVDYFVDDPDVRVIFCLIEAVRRPEDFLTACRRARDAGKPVVVLKMGASEGGREAALAHTGSLAGSVQAFDAIAGAAGVIRVESADAAINLIDYLAHSPFPQGEGVGALVISGGVRGLSLDAAERYGVALPPFGEATLARLRELVGDGVQLSNPLDAAGFLNQPIDVLKGMIQALEDDPDIGTILLHEDLPPDEGQNDANRRRAERV
ncbi:MAG: CoA-binding protein, partial [Alphaproteobacteria bacterium]